MVSDSLGAQKIGLADKHCYIRNPTEDTATHDGTEIGNGFKAEALGFRARDDSCGERMFAALLQRSSQAKHFVLIELRNCHCFHETRFPLRERAGFVHDESGDLFNRSGASALFTSRPSCASRPTPIMMDIGVARPSALGEAMMRTATAFTMA